MNILNARGISYCVIGGLAVKHGGPLAPGAAHPDAGAELLLLYQFIIFQGIGQAFGHPLQVVDGAEAEARRRWVAHLRLQNSGSGRR